MTPARFAARAVGYLVDSALYLATYAILFVAAVVAEGSGADPALAGATLALSMPIYLGARWYFNAAGWSPGKRLLGLRVVDPAGRKPGMRRGGLRTAASLLSILPGGLVGLYVFFISALPLGVGYLWALVDARGRTWHDLVAGTLVIGSPAPGGRTGTAISNPVAPATPPRPGP